MNTNSVRNFELSDLGPLHQMMIETIDHSYSGIYPERAVEFFKTYHSKEKILERSEKGEILIIEKDKEKIATGTIVGHEIFGVFVRPSVQGKGYGKIIMNALERRAEKNGFTQVSLAVSLPSRKFYESLGYEIIRDCSLDVGEGQCLDYWDAIKTLASDKENETDR